MAGPEKGYRAVGLALAIVACAAIVSVCVISNAELRTPSVLVSKVANKNAVRLVCCVLP